MIFIVYTEEEDSSSGVSFSGIFETMDEAILWARSEGPNYKVLQTSFGPIDWNKLNPLPPMPWDDPAVNEVIKGWD